MLSSLSETFKSGLEIEMERQDKYSSILAEKYPQLAMQLKQLQDSGDKSFLSPRDEPVLKDFGKTDIIFEMARFFLSDCLVVRLHTMQHDYMENKVIKYQQFRHGDPVLADTRNLRLF